MKLDRRLANQRRTTISSSGNLTQSIIVERSTGRPSFPLCLLCALCGKPAFQEKITDISVILSEQPRHHAETTPGSLSHA